MIKKKTSKKHTMRIKDIPTVELENTQDLSDFAAGNYFKDKSRVAVALLDCLIDNDVTTFMEILDAFLRVNRKRIALKGKLARATVQLAFSGNANPTIKTIAKITHASFVDRNKKSNTLRRKKTVQPAPVRYDAPTQSMSFARHARGK